MHGYPFSSAIAASQSGEVIVDGIGRRQVSLRTFSSSEFDMGLLVRRSEAAAIPALHNFYEQTHATFPENMRTPDEDLVHGIYFDGKPYVYHRYDKASQDIVFRPLKPDPVIVSGLETTDPFVTGMTDAATAQAAIDDIADADPFVQGVADAAAKEDVTDEAPTQAQKDQVIAAYAEEVENDGAA